MNSRRITRLDVVLAVTVAIVGAVSVGASDVFDGTSTDVWVLDENGVTKASYTAAGLGWTLLATDVGGGQIEIDFLGGPVTIQAVDVLNDTVLVNQSSGSLPVPGGVLPPVSLAGIARSLSDISDPSKPGVGIIPVPGSFTQTIEVTITGTDAPSGAGSLSVHWKIDGGAEQSVTAESTTFHIVDDGTTSIEFWSKQDGVESAHVTESYTLAAVDGPRRDTDGDGIPDKWENDNGLDPLEDDYASDRDGDGWSDFDEIIRGSDPDDPGSVPLDTDGDGWSDYDEARRGTDPNDVQLDYPDAPVARRLTEVEYLLNGTVYSDDALITVETGLGDLTVLDTAWVPLYDQATLPTAQELTDVGLIEADIPSYLRASAVDAALAGGTVPTLRLPAGDAAVLRVRHQTAGVGDCWVAKGWLYSAPDVLPGDVTDYLAGLGTPWNTPAEWEAGYSDYLDATLVQSSVVDLFPSATLGSSLMEVVANWYGNLTDGTIVLLGDDAGTEVASAVLLLASDLSAADRSLDSLHDDLVALTATGEPLDGVLASIASVYADCDAATLTTTTTQALAEILQLDALTSVNVYVPRLMSTLSLSELDALAPVDRATLLDPASDSDGEGLLNSQELALAPGSSTDPLAIDTDGDYVTDDEDLCPLDPSDACTGVEYGEMDSDGDGIVDALDNCMNDSNADQLDGNGDGIGDLCRKYANILRPASHVHVQIGAFVEFESIVTELIHSPPLSYLWDFDGAATNSLLPSPGAVQMNVPGTFTVGLTVTDNAGTSLGTETRTLVVGGTAPTVSLDGPYFGVEGDAVAMMATAGTAYGVIESYAWDFGDATTGSGNPTTHAYPSDGVYDVEVTATDSRDIPATAASTATISDSFPTASFGFSVGVDPLTLDFLDQSTAFDGVVGWEWQFGDGGTASIQNPSHTYPVEDLYTVVLEVTDGDGSPDDVSVDVFVGECYPNPSDLVSWWPLDELSGMTAFDAAAGNDGTLVNAPTPSIGNVDGALDLDGFGQHVEVPDDPTLGLATSDFSVAAWVFPDGATGVMPILEKRSDGAGRGLMFSLNGGQLALQVADAAGAVFEDYLSSVAVPVGQWSFVAVTVDRDDPTGVRFYLDGVEPGAPFDPTAKQGSLSNGATLRVGASHAFGVEIEEFWDGRLDEVQLFSRVLTAHEVATIGAADTRGQCKALCAAPAADVAAWWPLDETTPESSLDLIAGNDGVHLGCPTPIQGLVDTALGFDGTDDGVTVADAAELDFGTGDLTIEAWVQIEPAVATGVRPVVDKREGTALTDAVGWVLYLSSGVPTLQLADQGVAPGFTDYAAVASVADGEWHHLAATVDRDDVTGVRLYVDGVLVATHDGTGRPGDLDNAVEVRIGTSHALPSVFRFDGGIDEVALYARALAAEEVQAVFEAGPLGKCKSTVATDLVLTQTPIQQGQTATFTVTGAGPGETVFLARSPSVGCGPCIPAFGGLCVNLSAPTLLGTGVADATGTASIAVPIPPAAPLIELSFQAVIQRGVGGSASVKSNVNTAPILP